MIPLMPLLLLAVCISRPSSQPVLAGVTKRREWHGDLSMNASLALQTVVPVDTDALYSFFISDLLGTSSLCLGPLPLQDGGGLSPLQKLHPWGFSDPAWTGSEQLCMEQVGLNDLRGPFRSKLFYCCDYTCQAFLFTEDDNNTTYSYYTSSLNSSL